RCEDYSISKLLDCIKILKERAHGWRDTFEGYQLSDEEMNVQLCKFLNDFPKSNTLKVRHAVAICCIIGSMDHTESDKISTFPNILKGIITKDAYTKSFI